MNIMHDTSHCLIYTINMLHNVKIPQKSMTLPSATAFALKLQHKDALHQEINKVGWRRGVVVAELVVSTKLLYAEPG